MKKTDREIITETFDRSTKDKEFAQVSKWHLKKLQASWISYYMTHKLN
jgi:hypothetical protein